MNIPTPSETEKAKDQWIKRRLWMTYNEKYVRRGQTLIIKDDPQRLEEVAVVNRNKVGASFQCAESLFAALVVVKSMTRLPYRHLQGLEAASIYRGSKPNNVADRITHNHYAGLFDQDSLGVSPLR